MSNNVMVEYVSSNEHYVYDKSVDVASDNNTIHIEIINNNLQ